MPSIGKFVIGNISTLQSASNIYVDPANYKYVHASSSNVELAFKNIDDKLEDLVDSSITTSGNNTFTGTNTFSGKLTASNGLNISGGELVANKNVLSVDGNAGAAGDSIVVFDASDSDLAKTITITQLSSLITVEDDAADFYAALTGSNTLTGTNTFSGKLTASNGLNISGGELVANKNILSADGNAGNTSDSIMLFDASDSDLAKTITISQLSTLVDTGGDSADFYAALTASNTFTGTNVFSGDLTASQGLTSLAAISSMGNVTGNNLIAQGSLTASNGIAVTTQDDGATNAALTVTSASFLAQGPEIQILATSTVTVGGITTITGDTTIQGAITGSNGLTITSPDSAKGSATSFEVGSDGLITLGIEGLAVSVPGATTFFSDLTASGGALVSSNNTSTTPAFIINQQGTGDAAMSFAISGDTYTMGIDNSDSDLFKLSFNSSLGSNDLLEIDNNGNIKIGSNSSASPTGSLNDNSLYISSTHKAFLHLEADSDNSGEEGTAYIKFEQDGGAVQAIIGTIGGGNTLDPEGNPYTGTFDNNLLIGTQENFGMQLGTNSTARINIENDGEIKLISTAGQTTANSANLVINSTSGLLARSTSDRRQKHTITAITSSLADVCQLEPKYFYDVADVSGSTKLLGLVADETEAVFPELVPERDLPSDVYRSVAYDRVCVYLINALKEVKQRLEDLEGGE